MRASVPAVWLTLLACSLAGPARAEPPSRRAVPDYDGRPDEPLSAGEVLVWIPRVILFPAYLVAEYGIRWPLGRLVSWMERGGMSMVSTGPVGGLPTVAIDLGLRPAFGLYLFADPLSHPDNRLGLSVAYGGPDWLSVGAKERLILAPDEGGELVLRASYLRRPDFPFYGLGPDAREAHESFYRLSRPEAAVSIALRREHAGFEAELRWAQDERDESHFGKHTLRERGFDSEYFLANGADDWGFGHIVEQRLTVFADTRGRGPTYLGSGTGARIDLRGALGLDPADAVQQRWLRTGGEASLFLDVTGTRRVFGLTASADVVEPLGDDPIPVGALVGLGGSESMQGFYEGRFLGHSAATATLQYHWPIASFLDAKLFTSVGNVFGERFEGFALDELCGSGGFTIHTNTGRDPSLEILFAAGTRRFAQGPLAIESIRFAVTMNRGF